MLQLSALPQRAARAWRLRPAVRPARRLHWPVAASAPKPAFGNTNRLAAAGSDQGGGPGYRTEAEGDTDGSLLRAAQPLLPPGRALPPVPQSWAAKWEEAKGRLLYSYYNWRQDTWSDLQLFATFNLLLLLLGAWVQGSVVRQLDGTVPTPADTNEPEWFGSLYSVIVWALGEDLPSAAGSGVASQVFAVLIVTLGLVSFALVLALVEQVVLEVLESNVRRGSQVYEEGHIVVLAWCESATDLSQLTRILGQVCHANAGRERSVVVVLTQDREKLEMEDLFRKSIPESRRLGTRFVFRQGSPLDPNALRMVAATRARSIVLTSDTARNAVESDSECMRTAVLLEELVEAEYGEGSRRGPSIIFQLLNPDSLRTINYACSDRVRPVAAFQIQARRIARIVYSPVVAVASNLLMDFRSSAHICIHDCPQLVGVPFGELFRYFPSAIVAGVINPATSRCQLNPPSQRSVRPGERLIMVRPGPAGDCPEARPLPRPLPASIGAWSPDLYTLVSQDEEPLGVDMRQNRAPRPLTDYLGQGMGDDEERADGARPALPPLHCAQKGGLFVLPLQYSSSLVPASDLLIIGWGRNAFMWALLQELDHGPQALPPGSNVTLLNQHSLPEGLEASCKCEARGITSLNLRHVRADPRNIFELSNSVDISQYKAAIVLADALWDGSSSGNQLGSYNLTQEQMLRIDAGVLMCQLNVRTLLEEQGLPDISIVVQRVTLIGNTKFEDATRLPLGLPVNPSSFIGKVLAQAAFDTSFLRAWAELGVQTDMVVQDSSAFSAHGEELSFLDLQARASAVNQCLVGYFRVPTTAEQPLEIVINPHGLEARTERLVWNRGDCRCKLLTLAPKKAIREAQASALTSSLSDAGNGSGSGSASD